MNAKAHARQHSQLAFQAGHENIIVGDIRNCPLSAVELKTLSPDSPYVVEVFDKGLTARVFHLKVGENHYNLKQKRPEALVKNVDGETSFLNEVQRRRDFTSLKSAPQTKEKFTHIVPTLYADYRQGIILSPWISGTHLKNFSKDIFQQILETSVACEEVGLMEWDLCSGNILDDNGFIWLFDFGYMYPFNPLVDFNSNGTSDPLFHACERFETRNFFGWTLQNPYHFSEEKILELYRDLKLVALDVYRKKYEFLKKKEAGLEVLNWVKSFISQWENGLKNQDAFLRLFYLENFRSQVLDIEDDLHGKSCTDLTLRRIDFVQKCLLDEFQMLSRDGGLFYSNANKTQSELLTIYDQKRELALKYQLN